MPARVPFACGGITPANAPTGAAVFTAGMYDTDVPMALTSDVEVVTDVSVMPGPAPAVRS